MVATCAMKYVKGSMMLDYKVVIDKHSAGRPGNCSY